MEETNEELPNFSIGIDLLRPDSTSCKNEAEFKKLARCAVSQICQKTSCSKFWPRDIHWEQKRHQLAINKKGKISVFIVVFKFVMHFCYRRQITQQDKNLLLIKTTTVRSSQVAVMTSHYS